MSESIEVTILPNMPLKRVPWTIIEVLEVPLTLDASLSLCLIELTSPGQDRHGSNKDLSIAPEWYHLPDNFALGIYDGRTHYLNGTQCGFRYIEPQEVKLCIEIGLSSDHLISIEEKSKAFDSKMPNTPVQYTDQILYNAIQEHIPR